MHARRPRGVPLVRPSARASSVPVFFELVQSFLLRVCEGRGPVGYLPMQRKIRRNTREIRWTVLLSPAARGCRRHGSPGVAEPQDCTRTHMSWPAPCMPKVQEFQVHAGLSVQVSIITTCRMAHA